MWRFERERPNKDSGNFITVALDAFLQLAEGLSEHELQHRLLGGDAREWTQASAEHGASLVKKAVARI